MSKSNVKIIASLLNDLSCAYYDSDPKQLKAVNRRIGLYEQLYSAFRIMADTSIILNSLTILK